MLCETPYQGFVAQHLGGHQAPDGVLDAPLGPLAYRAMIECKTWQGTGIPRLDVAEAAKYRTAFHADVALLVAPALAEYDVEFNSELRAHQISAWSTDDLAQLLEFNADPHELRPLFVPGIAALEVHKAATLLSGDAAEIEIPFVAQIHAAQPSCGCL